MQAIATNKVEGAKGGGGGGASRSLRPDRVRAAQDPEGQ